MLTKISKYVTLIGIVVMNNRQQKMLSGAAIGAGVGTAAGAIVDNRELINWHSGALWRP